jgi:hypothetical protein
MELPEKYLSIRFGKLEFFAEAQRAWKWFFRSFENAIGKTQDFLFY